MNPSRYALRFAYDGTDFKGFARQREHRTVQGELERCLSMLLRTDVQTTAAGRTDTGVHAAGNVVSFDARAGIDLEWLQRRLNVLLQPEIAVGAAAVVPDKFSARFSAKQRDYEYRIYGGPSRSPFLDRFALWEPLDLDVAAMDRAIKTLIGEHDFSSFCRANERSLVRLVRVANVRRRAGGMIVITIKGSSFCHQMVRSVAGCLLAIGRGKKPVSWLKQVLDAKDRQAAVEIAKPRGLTLFRVHYRPDPFKV